MSDECQYYYNDSSFWGYGYTCLLKQSEGKDRTVDSDWVHKFCWNYNYHDCPFYQTKHGSSSSGCYLTSACTQARGLPDDCEELTVLRAFRDTYVRALPTGEADVRRYYATAPQIVNAIHRGCAAPETLDRIYRELVQPCVQLIRDGKNEAAYRLYKAYSLALEERYL